MIGRVLHAEPMGLEISTGKHGARVRIPRMESETDYLMLEEQLLSEVSRRQTTAWIIDLSEHTEGVTLVVAGMLSEVGEEAQRSGCTVQCVGLRKPHERDTDGGCAAGVGLETEKHRGWTGIAEESSHLRW